MQDGHLTLNTGGGDFFSNPLGSGPMRTTSLDKSPRSYAASSAAAARSSGGGSRGGKQPVDEGPGVAQQRFGNAKSISSSAFHNDDRGESDYERQQRLAQFQGQVRSTRGSAGHIVPCYCASTGSSQQQSPGDCCLLASRLTPACPLAQGAISSDAYFGREDRSKRNTSSNMDVSASELVQKIRQAGVYWQPVQQL